MRANSINNNNNMGFEVLVPKQEDGIDKECQERCRLAGIEFAAQRSATTRATTRATTFSQKYERTIIPKGVDSMYRIVHKLL